jgi:ssDNA-binding Zn-finger/Zn-ribbon topoisomerase 1
MKKLRYEELKDSNDDATCSDCGGELIPQHVNEGLYWETKAQCKKCDKCGKLHYFLL